MNKMKLKKTKDKKRFNLKFVIKFLFLILIVYLSYSLTLKFLAKNNIDITEEKYVSMLLDESYNRKNKKYTYIVNESLKLFSNMDLSNPSSFLDSKIKNNIKEVNYEKKEKDAKAGVDNYNLGEYEKVTSYISNPDNTDKENPIIYIYNTHQLETYSNSGLESYNITPNIMMTSYLLSEKLNKLGISTIVEDTNISEFIKISNLKDKEPYSVTRIFIKGAKEKYPSLKYFIDIHRDSVSKDISTCTIGNKNYARILFVVGTTNPNYSVNEKLARQIDDISDKLYPCMSRGIYKRETKGWSDAYNQDINPGGMLIEVGAKENTIDEVLNTVDALSVVLSNYIRGE